MQLGARFTSAATGAQQQPHSSRRLISPLKQPSGIVVILLLNRCLRIHRRTSSAACDERRLAIWQINNKQKQQSHSVHKRSSPLNRPSGIDVIALLFRYLGSKSAELRRGKLHAAQPSESGRCADTAQITSVSQNVQVGQTTENTLLDGLNHVFIQISAMCAAP